MAEKKEKSSASARSESNDSNEWNVADPNEQRKHNMWGSLAQALADSVDDPTKMTNGAILDGQF